MEHVLPLPNVMRKEELLVETVLLGNRQKYMILISYSHNQKISNCKFEIIFVSSQQIWSLLSVHNQYFRSICLRELFIYSKSKFS